MTDAAVAPTRCGIDTVEIARIERGLRETPAADLGKLFSDDELRESGQGQDARAWRRASPRRKRA
jgi:hypothetical protein